MMPEFCFSHLGINHDCESDAALAAEVMENTFGFHFKEGRSSIFAGVNIELMKAPFHGERGHIGIETPNVDEAVEWLAERGVKTLAGTENYKDDHLSQYILI